MTIKLGLERMQALYSRSPQRWKAIHVAGTNGKGSVCSHISALLTRAGISHGRFTSPFIRRPEDSILINNAPIPTELFRSCYNTADAPEGLTHFERMTYAAFRAFDEFDVKYGVIETGLGGRLDSTNVLRNKAVTVITKIGLDHQEYLGDTIEKIAAEKGGIMNGAPCVISGQNSPEALGVLSDVARRVGSKIFVTTDDSRLEQEKLMLAPSSLSRGLYPLHVLDNAACAIKACEQLEELKDSNLRISGMLKLPHAHMEGRLQMVDVTDIPDDVKHGRVAPLILDGAHNMDAAKALASHVDRRVRTVIDLDDEPRSTPVTWVIGMSNPRETTASEFLASIVRPQDNVVFTEYERPVGETASLSEDDYFLSFRPEPLQGEKLQDSLKSTDLVANNVESHTTVDKAIEAACLMAKSEDGDPPIVVTGSLYLIADVLKWVDRIKE